MPTYEQIALTLQRLDCPERPEELRVEWLYDRRVGAGKDADGRYVLLIAGEPLRATSEAVVEALRHGIWQTADGDRISGTLLRLPADDEFRLATATISAEFLARGISSRSAEDVFAEIEGFVALILRRILLPDTYLLGLTGELLVLRELVSAIVAARIVVSDPTAVWRGWQQQVRDFDLGRSAIEVKTTTLTVSRHSVGDIDQVEPRSRGDGPAEQLYVASIGLRRSVAGRGISVTTLTDDILALLTTAEMRTSFLGRLASYGPVGFRGYRHAEMSQSDAYTQGFTTTFVPRIYDMSDPNIRIIRRADLALSFPMVLPDGISYRVEFPGVVPGSINNPRLDLALFARSVVGELTSVRREAADDG